MSTPLVYIIIVNWNGLSHLEYCLHSLANLIYPNKRVLVVDNGSTDGSVNFVKQNYPHFFLYEEKRNLGFTGGNNIGIRYAIDDKADFVALLNNDTRVEPDWLDALIDLATSDKTIGLCESQQYSWDGQHKILFNYRPEWVDGESYLVDATQTLSTRPVFFASGCSLLIRRELIQHIGLLDARYFAGTEDVDLSLRAWIAGYQVLSVPSSIVYHRMSASSNQFLRSYWGYRNQLITLLKNYEWCTLRLFARPIFSRWFFTKNRTALRAMIATLHHMPETLYMRQELQSQRKRTDAEIFSITNVFPS